LQRRAASQGGNYPLVSSDIIGSPYSAIVDLSLTQVMGNMLKVIAWYDNEYGYANRLVEETKGSSVTASMPTNPGSLEAFLKALLTSSLVVSLLSRNVKSDSDPTATGTRTDKPLNKPVNSGRACVAASVAPVVVGTIFCAAALALL
jgi:hypothetical protein